MVVLGEADERVDNSLRREPVSKAPEVELPLAARPLGVLLVVGRLVVSFVLHVITLGMCGLRGLLLAAGSFAGPDLQVHVLLGVAL